MASVILGWSGLVQTFHFSCNHLGPGPLYVRCSYLLKLFGNVRLWTFIEKPSWKMVALLQIFTYVSKVEYRARLLDTSEENQKKIELIATLLFLHRECTVCSESDLRDKDDGSKKKLAMLRDADSCCLLCQTLNQPISLGDTWLTSLTLNSLVPHRSMTSRLHMESSMSPCEAPPKATDLSFSPTTTLDSTVSLHPDHLNPPDPSSMLWKWLDCQLHLVSLVCDSL